MKFVIEPKDLEKASVVIDEYKNSKKFKEQQDLSFLTIKDIRELISNHENNELFCHTLDRMI